MPNIGERKMVKFEIWFPGAQRWITFEEPYFCGEYDTLSFPIADADANIKYQHLAGTSYIPNEDIEDVLIKVIQESKGGTKQ